MKKVEGLHSTINQQIQKKMKIAKKTNISALTATLALLCATPTLLNASPEHAEERAYQVAAKYRDRGFYVQPINSGLLGRGQMYKVTIPVVRGLDYLVIAAGDAAAQDIDVYVYSDLGTLILDDRRPLSDALVQFRAQYTGEVYAYIFMARTDMGLGLPSWAAFVGRRGNVAGPDPESKGGGGAQVPQPDGATAQEPVQ